MTLAVVGAGAMGGLWAACLAAKHEVVIVDVAAEVVAAIGASGISIQAADGSQQVARVRATSDPGAVGPVDVLFIFVKAHHTAAAAEQIQPLVGPNTIVATLQNGLGNAEVLAGVFPDDQIVVGVTYHSARVLEPGKVAHTAHGPTFVGPHVNGAALDHAETVARLLGTAGLDVRATPNVKMEIWKKLVLNSAALPVTALARVTASACNESPQLRALVDAVATESVTVARALGYDIDLQERLDRIHTAQANSRGGKGSMLQDVEAGRKTEIEVINGAVVHAADQVGVDVPLNRAMMALIRGVESGAGS
ncbi:MAG: ketopantoate reductase family protein [Thermomicrobiales bacterium]